MATTAAQYAKTDLRNHILARPDSYCGAAKPKTDRLWVLKGGFEAPELVERDVTYTPALCALLDELLQNACDRTQCDPTCTEIRVDWDDDSVTVYNTGHGIPVEPHPVHHELVPRMIFGSLLTSSNYDDSVQRTTGGRNGLGAKLCNVFARRFRVETSCAATGKRFVGVWRDNMTAYDGDKVAAAAKKDFTRVTFWPDWARLGQDGFTADHRALLARRVVDIAGTVNRAVKVYANGVRVPIASFKAYCALYVPGDADLVYDEPHERWQVAVAASPDAEFRQVSFVNNLNTQEGGSHVDLVVEGVVRDALEALRRAHKDVAIKPAMLRARLWVFVNARIQNPSFSSQTKTKLQTPAEDFGSAPDLAKLIKRVLAKKLFEHAIDFARFAQDKQLKKSDGKKQRTISGIPKLEDANRAGSDESEKCTLWLTEGDSAKALVMSGLTVIGRNYNGVFPLRGKPLNVREATTKQLVGNEELIALKKILGLRQGVEYKDVSELRYGRVMITTDADKDGSHIKGLLINLFQVFWPDLYRRPGFLCEFITPIVRCTRGDAAVEFFSQADYAAWQRADPAAAAKYAVKYYKGLGTSTRADAHRYFSRLDRHVVAFRVDGADDDAALALAFEEKQANARKEWIGRASEVLDSTDTVITVRDFVNKELVHYSVASNERAIPHLMDGLKPSQRKILFTMLRKKFVKDEKVATIAGHVTQLAAYHHGEVSLHATTIGMAQDFVGSNNLNLLVPSGQFGTRAQGGKDAASARYIFTRLAKPTVALFCAEDDPLLAYVDDDGAAVEPVYYAPVLPLVLVNGAEGIGTGYSTAVPCFRPADLARNLVHLMRGEPQDPLVPHYRDFTGTIRRDDKNPRRFIHTGTAAKTGPRTAEITELPIGWWTQDYKKTLTGLVEKKRAVRFEEHHDDFHVRFRVFLTPEQMVDAEKDLVAYFHLSDALLTSNMVLFAPDGRLKRYERPEDIVAEYYAVRLALYERRREHLIADGERDLRDLDQRVRFIGAIVSGALDVRGRPRADIEAYLDANGFVRQDGAFDFLLDMKLAALTRERADQLTQQHARRAEELARLRASTAQTLWQADLNALLRALQQDDAERAAAMASIKKPSAAPARPKKKARPGHTESTA